LLVDAGRRASAMPRQGPRDFAVLRSLSVLTSILEGETGIRGIRRRSGDCFWKGIWGCGGDRGIVFC
jgi:hypothetical protein